MAREPKLGRYRAKRTAGITNEPFGDESPATGDVAEIETKMGAFVVHLHDATRRHYDVRLEASGVLLSFAVPRGPSLDPSEKVLAMKTEDHPIEYLDFEDVIPDGQYGAGPMIVWDRGQVEYLEGPAEDELRAGKLHVELRGTKLRGRWAFVKLAKSAQGNEWLFFKKQDEHASADRKILEELPDRILSGLTVEELPLKEVVAERLVGQALAAGAKQSRKGVEALLPGAARIASSSGFLIEPGTRPRELSPSLFDPELDGVRVLATRDDDVIVLETPRGDALARIEAFYPEVVRALRSLPPTRLALDGELVAFDPAGRPKIELLARRVARLRAGEAHTMSASLSASLTAIPVTFVVKDILAVGDVDTRPLPLEERRAILAALLPSVGVLRIGALLDGEEANVLASCLALGIGSVIAKAKGSPYVHGGLRWLHGRLSPWARLTTGLAPRSRARIDHGAPDAETALRQVIVSNREKVFWPDEPSAPRGRVTKGDLVDYYGAVADVLLPYLKDRPVILVRYPDGIDGKSFFQWNVSAGMPAWIRTMTIHDVDDQDDAKAPPPSQRTPKRVFLVDDAATLLYIANLGCIPLHVLASRAPDLSRADFVTIDFDVKQSELRHAVTLARTLKTILDTIGLVGLPKTSGQTGLHVLVPLGTSQGTAQPFDTARTLAELLGRLLVEQHPDIATMDRVVSRRGERVYVDTGQTGTSRAIVAPYSPRAVRGATVSTPLAWDEVDASLDPGRFTLFTVPPRIAERGDLLDGLLPRPGRPAPHVGAAVSKLAELFSLSPAKRRSKLAR